MKVLVGSCNRCQPDWEERHCCIYRARHRSVGLDTTNGGVSVCKYIYLCVSGQTG